METPESQTQTQIQTLKQIIKKKVAETKTYEIRRKTYRVIRSFVESSSKPMYPWNVGRVLNKNTIAFEKPRRWTLIIYTNDDNAVHVELCDTAMATVMEYSNGKITIDGSEFDINSHEVLLSTALVPALMHVCDRPILLFEAVEKLREYVAI